MPPSASPDIPSPVRTTWLGFARPLRGLIGRGAERPSGQDWTVSAKALRKSRRPVWE